MYRQKFTATIALLGVLALAGCSAAQPGGSASAPSDAAAGAVPAAGSQVPGPAGGQGIAYLNIPFDVIAKGQAPNGVERLVNEMKDHAAAKTTVIGDTTYAIITAGSRPTGGYTVVVHQVGDSEGKLEILYSIDKPAAGSMVTEAIDYPYTVVKFTNPANLPISFHTDAQ